MVKNLRTPEGGPIGFDEKTRGTRAAGGYRAGRLEEMNDSSQGLVDLIESVDENKRLDILAKLQASGISPKDTEARIKFVRKLLS